MWLKWVRNGSIEWFQGISQSLQRQIASGTEIINFWSTMLAYNSVFSYFNYYGDFAIFLKLEFDFQTSVVEFAYCRGNKIRKFFYVKVDKWAPSLATHSSQVRKNCRLSKRKGNHYINIGGMGNIYFSYHLKKNNLNWEFYENL